MQRLTNSSMDYPPKKRKSPSPSPSKPSSTEPQRSCPRCDSPNTKFCYYNNYSSSQPRHFCRACRRYWTHGGALRNLPRAATRRSTKFSMQPPTAAARPPVHLQLAAPAGATSSPAPPWCFPGPAFHRQPTPELSTVLPAMGGAQDIAGELFRPPLLVSAGEEGDRYFSDLLFRGLQDGSGGAARERRTPTTSSGPFD